MTEEKTINGDKELTENVSVACPDCGGKGFTERAAGLITIGCEACHGTGVIQDMAKTVGVDATFILTGERDGIITGTRQDDSGTGGKATGKPRKSRKSKARKKT